MNILRNIASLKTILVWESAKLSSFTRSQAPYLGETWIKQLIEVGGFWGDSQGILGFCRNKRALVITHNVLIRSPSDVSPRNGVLLLAPQLYSMNIAAY